MTVELRAIANPSAVPDTIARPLDWQARAACRDADPDLFFPETGGPDNGTNEALAICATCPVIAQCRAYADRVEARYGQSPHGVWGGSTADERRLARRRAQKGRKAS